MSLKSKLEHVKDRIFTNRTRETDIFLQAISSLESSFNILNIYGVGGVGKSYLVNAYQSLCKIHHIPVALIDGSLGYSTIVEVLRSISTQIGKTDKGFKEFDLALGKYYGIQSKLQDLIGPVSGVILSGVKSVHPIGNAIVEGVGEENIKTFMRQNLSRSDASFYINAEEHLTNLLVHGINSISEYSKTVIIFDTYEHMTMLDTWLRDVFLGSELSSNVIIVISGRYPLGEQWKDWQELVKSVELRSFKKEDAIKYLQKRNINDPTLIDLILESTDRFPWALALEADIENQAELVPDESKASQREIARKRIVERFLDQIKDNESRSLIDICSVLHAFDEDILAHFFGPENVGTYLRMLQSYSFVAINSAGKNIIHDNVREYLRHELRTKAKKRWTEINKQAARFFLKGATNSKIDVKDQENFLFEYLYHLLEFDEKKGREVFRRTFEKSLAIYNLSFCDTLLKLVESHHDEITKSTAKYLRGRLAFIRSRWPQALEIFQQLGKSEYLEPQLKSSLAFLLGVTYDNLGLLEESFQSHLENVEYCRSVGDNIGTGRGLVELADACWLLGKMDLEEKYLNEALNLLDNSNDKSGIARALLGLEHLYRYTGRWDAAAESSLRASSIASEIDDKWIKARALYGLGRYFTFVGKFRRAEQSFRESIDLFTRLDFLQRVADARGQLSVVLSQTNRDQEAVLEVEQSLKIHEELKALRDVGYDYLTLALIWLHAKDYEKAEEFAHKSLDVSQQTKYAHGIAVSQMILGDVMVNIGESDEATQWLIQAEEGFEQTKNIYSQVDVTLKLADLRHVTGNSKERDNLLGLSEKLLTKWMPDLQARYHFIKGKVEIESGNRPRGFKWLSDALKFSLLYNCFYLDRLADEIFDYLKLFAPDAVVACGQFLIQYWQNELYDDTSLINIEAKDRVEQMPIPLPTFTFIEKITKFLTDTGIDESILEPK